MNDHVRPCNLKPQQRDLTPVLRRPVEPAAICGRLSGSANVAGLVAAAMCSAFWSAVHMTAGHNALRGSGPSQTPAFDDAMAQGACPDRRIDRLCITCCSPSQPSHHAGCPARFRLPRKRDGFLVSLAPGHHGPDYSGDLVGERDSRNLGRPPRQQGREPGPMFGAMDLGVTDDRERAGHEQAAQIAVTLFAYIAEPVLASTRVLLRHNTDPGREVAP